VGRIWGCYDDDDYYYFNLGTPFPREYLKLTKQYKGRYNRQSVQSAADKLSCNYTALKRYTKTLLLLLHSWLGKISQLMKTMESQLSEVT